MTTTMKIRLDSRNSAKNQSLVNRLMSGIPTAIKNPIFVEPNAFQFVGGKGALEMLLKVLSKDGAHGQAEIVMRF